MSQADDKNRISAITGTYQILCFKKKNSWLTCMYNLLVDQIFDVLIWIFFWAFIQTNLNLLIIRKICARLVENGQRVVKPPPPPNTKKFTYKQITDDRKA